MSLDGRFLAFLGNELNHDLEQGRIQKIYQLTKTDFLFLIRANSKNLQLSISLSTSLTRIHLTKVHVDRPDNPGGFCMLLRKYLEGGVILLVKTIDSDRIVDICIQNVNDFGETKTSHLIMEIMGRYANLIVADESMTIIDAYKHLSPFEESTRTILKGALYVPPLDQRIDPFDREKALLKLHQMPDPSVQDLISAFKGFSPLLSKFVLRVAQEKNISVSESFQEMLDLPIHPTLFIENGVHRFYYTDVFPSGEKHIFSSLSALLDTFYGESAKIERMKQLSKNIYQLAKREFEKNKNKLEKLTRELDTAHKAEQLRINGDLILQNLHQIHRGDLLLKTNNYETGETIEIELDRLLTPIQNANLYYKKYKKSKNAIGFIEEQIEITNQQIRYFDLLIHQIENAQYNDLDEIHEELSKLGFLRTKNKKLRKGRPYYFTYIDEEGVLIYVGKNNLQNEYITHKLAKSNEWWFHTKDIHGSHVVVSKSGELTETTIRTAAMLAAYFSKGRLSSSVPVDYTLVKNVKKIPGSLGSNVQYHSQKTIYIDPDESIFERIKQVKN